MKRFIFVLVLLAVAAAAVVWVRTPSVYFAHEWARVCCRKTTLYEQGKTLYNTASHENDRSWYSTHFFYQHRNCRDAHVQFVLSTFVLDAALQEPGIAQLECLKNENNKADWLRRNLKVEFLGSSEILQISMYGKDYAELNQILLAVRRVYRAQVEAIEQRVETRARALLEDKLKTAQTQLAEKTAEIKTTAGATDVADLDKLMTEWYHLKQTHDETAAMLDKLNVEIEYGPSVTELNVTTPPLRPFKRWPWK